MSDIVERLQERARGGYAHDALDEEAAEAPRFHGADAYEIERKIIEALAQQNSREGE